jgi:CheY-like chemotaxis protein
MKRVLIVDDEPAILFGLSEALADERRGLAVVTASGGQEALEILESQKIDLVLTDLRMPEVDGFELLAYLRRDLPHVPVILMTAHGADELARVGADEFECFSKPIDLVALRQHIQDRIAQRVRGKVENISLASFLQLLEMERKTCTLSVVAGVHHGKLHFRGGRLIGAEADGEAGQRAALEIVTWDQADVEISHLAKGVEPTLDGGLQFFLMEGMRLKDERERGLQPAAPADAREEDSALEGLVQDSAFEGLEILGSPEEVAGRIRDGLERAREIAGGLGTLLVEIGRGAVIGAAAVAEGLDLEGIADAFAQLLRARQLLAQMHGSGDRDRFEEVVITSADRQYLARILPSGSFFLLVALDRPAANLGMARLQLAGLERSLAEKLPALTGTAATPAEPARPGARKPGRRP